MTRKRKGCAGKALSMSTVGEIAKFFQLGRNGNGYRGPCPCCGDSGKTSKFTVRDGHSRPVWHCFAGELLYEFYSNPQAWQVTNKRVAE